MTEVMFDEEFDASVFVSPLSSDEPVESTACRPGEVPWDEAFDLVGFAVRLPRSLPDGARPTRCLVSPPGWVGHSRVIDPGGRYRLSIRQGPDLAEQVGRDHRTLITRDGVEFRVEEYRGEGFRTEIVAFEFGRDMVRDQLEPASGDDPRCRPFDRTCGVSELGQVLELMQTSEQRWRSLRAVGREWRHGPLYLGAFMAWWSGGDRVRLGLREFLEGSRRARGN